MLGWKIAVLFLVVMTVPIFARPLILMTNESAVSAGNLTGSGTASYLAKWTAASTLSNSIVTDSGTNVGIDVVSPQFKLHVDGTGNFTGNLFEGTGRVCTASNSLCYEITTTLPASNITNGTFGAGNYTFPNNVSAQFYFGDGSQLTGIQHGALILFLQNKTSDIANSFEMNGTRPRIGVETKSITVSVTDASLNNWTSLNGTPSIGFIPDGVYEFHIHARKTLAGSKDISLKWKLFQVTTAGVNNLIATSEEHELDTSLSAIDIHASSDEFEMNTTDRLKLELLAVLSGSGGNPVVEYQLGGAVDSRVELPASAISISNFVPYSGAIFNVNLGNKNFTTLGSVGIGTNAPDSVFHIKANTPGTVGSHPAGQLIIQDPDDTVFGNVVITAYESDGSGNPDQQLWYLGSSSGSNTDIIFLNRRNANLQLGTNGVSRLTILGNGNVGIGTATPTARLHVTGTNTANNLSLNINNTLYVNASSNNVGIGTTAPSSNLHMVMDGKPPYVPTIFQTSMIIQDQSIGQGAIIYLVSNETNGFGNIAFGDSEDELNARIVYDHNNGMLRWYVANRKEMMNLNTNNLHIVDGSICVEDAGGTDCAGSTDGFVYADDFIEHSRPLPQDGLSAVMNMKNKEDGTLNHSSFPSYISNIVNWTNEYDENETLTKEAGSKLVEGISLSSQIKYLIKAVQELKEENDNLNARITELEGRI